MKIWSPRIAGKGADAKHRRGLCCVRFCTRPAPVGKHVCRTCQDRKWRAKHPEHHVWNNLRKSARRRGIECTVTLEEFKKFCADTGLISRIGRQPEDLTVDRRDPSLGYTYNNLRTLTNLENARLGGHLSGSGHRDQTQEQIDYADGSENYSDDERPF